uniref:PRA1 family protein n=1 Tax=Nelumbo nucifera TaxID=4432 RepID=A0A822XH56_NELNU|nr:TPA_asm: hypothetical protein HUJ06_019799 [Nelumbo nucifera]
MTCAGAKAKAGPARNRCERLHHHHFGLPSSPDKAVVRIINNLLRFWVYYALTVWAILLASFLPRRRVALVFLLVMTALAGLYLLLLLTLRISEVMTSPKAEPKSPAVIQVIFVPVLALIAMVLVLTQAMVYMLLASLLILTTAELFLTHAVLHFFASLAVGLPLILAHAVLLVRDGDLRRGREGEH